MDADGLSDLTETPDENKDPNWLTRSLFLLRSTGGTTVELDGKYTVNVSNAVRTQTRSDISNGSTRRVMRYVHIFIGGRHFGPPTAFFWLARLLSLLLCLACPNTTELLRSLKVELSF